MTDWTMHKSEIDASVNWTRPHASGGMVETRYVNREGGDHFVCYLSSQTGCAQACRMCHLTQTGQNRGVTDLTIGEIVEQARIVLDYHDSLGIKSPDLVHFAFMARGEPLANRELVLDSERLFLELAEVAREYDVFRMKFLISTILPDTFPLHSLDAAFPVVRPEIYYSLYSVDHDFRNKWLPRAISAPTGLKLLADWAKHARKVPKIHFCFIEGENSSITQLHRLIEAIKSVRLHADFNIVRYNPANDTHREPCEATVIALVDRLRYAFPDSRVDLVPRVGFDVKASCGMFVQPTDR